MARKSTKEEIKTKTRKTKKNEVEEILTEDFSGSTVVEEENEILEPVVTEEYIAEDEVSTNSTEPIIEEGEEDITDPEVIERTLNEVDDIIKEASKIDETVAAQNGDVNGDIFDSIKNTKNSFAKLENKLKNNIKALENDNTLKDLYKRGYFGGAEWNGVRYT